MDANEIKHDSIVNLVEMELRSRGHNKIIQHLQYKHLYKMPGEIDLFCRIDDYVLLFEIKGHYNRHLHCKAIKQLDHAEKYVKSLYKDKRIFKFFIYGDGEEIKYNWIKRMEVKK